MFHHIFLPEVNQNAIISNKLGKCEFPHELSKVLRLKTLGN